MKKNRTNLTVRLSPRERELLTAFRELFDLEYDSQALRKLIAMPLPEGRSGRCEKCGRRISFSGDGITMGEHPTFKGQSIVLVARVAVTCPLHGGAAYYLRPEWESPAEVHLRHPDRTA